MNAEELKGRTKEFAHRGVKLALSLPETALGRHVQGQLLRSSTSVPSNYRAACLAHSKAAFASKLSIVVEEADETAFWIEFLIKEGILSQKQCKNILQEAYELTAIFVASRKTSQKKTNNH
ncbi:MAG: four helix bundle protein [Planctomycetaceae bacterium]|nr:four helix bundle protein [Planctomycetaceae bacterium]